MFDPNDEAKVFLGYWASMHGPFCLWVSVCLACLGTRQSPQVPRRAGLGAAPGFPGRLWGLAIWISCPEAPAAWMLAVCVVLLLSGESWAKCLDAFENPVDAINGFRAWKCI